MAQRHTSSPTLLPQILRYSFAFYLSSIAPLTGFTR